MQILLLNLYEDKKERKNNKNDDLISKIIFILNFRFGFFNLFKEFEFQLNRIRLILLTSMDSLKWFLFFTKYENNKKLSSKTAFQISDPTLVKLFDLFNCCSCCCCYFAFQILCMCVSNPLFCWIKIWIIIELIVHSYAIPTKKHRMGER